MKRNFDEWLSEFRGSIANYEYYIDFLLNHKVIFDYLFKSSYMPV